MDWSPLLLSLKSSLTATVIVFVLGMVAGRWVVEKKGRSKWLLDVVFTLPLVLPPTVVGFVLLVTCGNNSWFGQLLNAFNLQVVFTPLGAVLSSIVVAFPLMYRAARGAFEQIDREVIWAARTLGLSERKIFLKVWIPEAWPGLIAGATLAFTRALGEFGATLMVAGNIPKVTQTMPLAIYFATTNGKMFVAAVWTVVITIVSCIMLWVMNRQNERMTNYES